MSLDDLNNFLNLFHFHSRDKQKKGKKILSLSSFKADKCLDWTFLQASPHLTAKYKYIGNSFIQ